MSGKEWFAGAVVDESHRPVRERLLRALLIVVSFLLPAQVDAQVPPARSDTECAVLGEMTMSAAVLDRNGIRDKQFLEVMAGFYLPVQRSPAVKERLALYITAIKNLVAREASRATAPHDLGERVRVTCVNSGGDLTPIFGVGI